MSNIRVDFSAQNKKLRGGLICLALRPRSSGPVRLFSPVQAVIPWSFSLPRVIMIYYMSPAVSLQEPIEPPGRRM